MSQCEEQMSSAISGEVKEGGNKHRKIRKE